MFRYIIFTIFLFSSSLSVMANNKPGISEWSQKYTHAGENIVCKKTIKNDYFFVMQSSGKIKIGYLIDITGKGSKPKPYIISWKFQDKDGNLLETGIQPQEIKRGVLIYNEKVYSESINYRFIDPEKTPNIYAFIELRKYDNKNSMPNNIRKFDDGNKQDDILVCVISN